MSKEKKKTNKRTNKVFVSVLAGLLCVMIVCLAVNKVFDSISESVTDSGLVNAGQQNNAANGANNSAVPQQYNNAQNAGTDSNAVIDNNTQGTVQPNGNTVTPNGGNTVTPNNGTQGGSTGGNTTSTDPLKFNTAQIVDYYNKCLRNTYSQPKFNVTKTEVIDVQLGEMLLNGKPATGIQGMANKVVASNAAKGGTKKRSYTNSNVAVDARERFILPTNLTSAGVRSCNISKSGAGYVINFTLKEERCDFRTKPPYNSSCTFPLDFTEIDLGGIGQITSAQFYYPGTTLQAQIDGQGRVVKTYVVMPLTVDNASGTGMGQTLNVDISGKWLCTNVFSF